jgi:hypothetical protein
MPTTLMRALPTGLLVMVLMALSAPIYAASPSRIAAQNKSLDRVLRGLFIQPRFQIDERIVADPYVPTHFRIRWIAPDRLRTDVYGTNLHVGDIGCVLGNFWVCGPDTAPHWSEMRHAVMDALFPQKVGSGNCCFQHLSAQLGPGSQTYTITALGDPWLFPLGCQGCDIPGTRLPPITSEHYQGILDVDRERRPLSLTSTITFDPPRRGVPRRVVHVQIVSFTYSGTWSVVLPGGARLSCPWWDRTPGSWCIRSH